MVRRLLLPAVLTLGCCGGETGPDAEPPVPPEDVLPDGNPIDLVIEPRLANEGLTPTPASIAEVCVRLGVDLLGRRLTEDEVESECEGRSLDDIIIDFQSRPGYQLVTDRHWRDRLETSDLFVNWNDVAELYALIADAHSHQMRYDDLATAVLAHPAFLLQFSNEQDRASAAFVAFFGRQPTSFERSDIGNLFRPWFLGELGADADFPYIERYFAHVVTGACINATQCTSVLFGGAVMDMSEFADLEIVRWGSVPNGVGSVLDEPGRLFTRQPFFWEAAADEILSRYLGWSDGGRAPRLPGTVVPEARAALANYLRITGDIADTERMVLSSWLYRQAASDLGDPERPIYAMGPLKPMVPEVWLASVARHTEDVGRDEPRYSDLWYWHEMYSSLEAGEISETTFNADLQRLVAISGNRMTLVDFDGVLWPQFAFRDHARSLGGAPSLGRVRQAPEGLAFSFFQDAIAAQLCAHVETTGTTVADIVDELVPKFYGRAAEPIDRETFTGAFASCVGADCDQQTIAPAICAALVTSPEMHFY